MWRIDLDAVEGVRINFAKKYGSPPVPLAAFLRAVTVKEETDSLAFE